MNDHQLLDEVSDRTTAAILSDLLARVAALEALGEQGMGRQAVQPVQPPKPLKARALDGGAGVRPQRG